MTVRPASRAFALAVLALGALLAVGCGGEAAPVPEAADPGPASAPAAIDFPTGPAVVVEVGYEPPGDHVPSTGAHLPANGKPTLVYVDAIW